MMKRITLFVCLFVLLFSFPLNTFADENPHEHNWEETVEISPTCLEPGLSVMICSVCGVRDDATEQVIPALEHSYDEYGVCRICLTHKDGWSQDASGIWHYYLNNITATGWKTLGGTWYLFNDAGGMLTGWQKSGSAWYYLKSSGAMATGWLKDGNTWYYLKSSGAMVTGWQQISGRWYYFNGSGAMQTGWQNIGGRWYYFNGSGAMQTGWQSIGGKWYYFSGSGAMQTGWQNIGGKSYYFKDSGVWEEQSSGGSGGYSTGTTTFVLNINSHVIHSANCPSVKRMNESNKLYVTGTRSEVLAQYSWYSVCNNCNAY